MLGPRQKKAVDAMRSGKYTKATGQLCEVRDRNEKCFCTLGIFLEEMVPRLPCVVVYPEHLDHGVMQYAGKKGTLPEAAIAYYGFRTEEGHPGESEEPLQSITRLNDDTSLTLAQIANIIEKHAAAYFVEPL